MEELTQKQIKQLKGLANTLNTRVQMGKNEISDTFVDMLDKSLTKHELVKVDLLKTVDTPIDDVAGELSYQLDANVIQIIGRVIVLYRQNKELPNHIALVK